jgi:hypothetical protein
VVAIVVAAAAPLAAQNQSPRYLPMSSWTTPYLEHLWRAGVLRGLDPLTRPLRHDELSRALEQADTVDAPEGVRSLVRMLARELAPPANADSSVADHARWRLEAHLGLLGASDARRWALRPSADSNGVFPEAGLAASLEIPHLVLVTHPRVENRLRYDPDYTGKKDRFVAGRNDEAYVLASWRYLDVFFGIADRNWGPPDVEGLLLSNSPYGFDHLLVRLGPRRLRLEMLATQLDPLEPWNTATRVNRYLSLHRVVVQPSSRLALSLFEGAVYAETGGTPRSFEPWYLNPLNLFLLAQYNDSPTSNALMGADAWLELRPALRAFGQVVIDDIQVDKRSRGDLEPPAYGFTLGLSGGAMRGAASWTAFYTRVTNVAYRTPAREEEYTIRRAGIARNFSDYDQATLRVTTAWWPRLLLGAELSLVRQGEGDIREQFPDTLAYDDSLNFLTGTIERTARVGVQASWTPLRGITLTADVGRNMVSNAGHVAGADRDRWVWRLRAEVRREREGVLAW